MAKYKPGQNGPLKGSVKNTEYIDSSQGNIIRSKPIPSGKITNAGQRVKSRMTYVAQSFQYIIPLLNMY